VTPFSRDFKYKKPLLLIPLLLGEGRGEGVSTKNIFPLLSKEINLIIKEL